MFMFGTFLWAGVSGILIPLGLQKLGADPAVSSSVFLLTTTLTEMVSNNAVAVVVTPIAIGLALLVLTPLLKRWMHGVH